MKRIKRGLAATLAAILVLSTQPAFAAQPLPEEVLQSESSELNESEDASDEIKESIATDSNAAMEDTTVETSTSDDGETEEETIDQENTDHEVASPSEAERKKADDEVRFNTGNYEFSVVSQEDFFEYDLGDAYFEDDGSYTINIPEQNPFFPYEVQFTYDGTVTEEWFMTPDDSLEIDGHTFYVSAQFDNTAITQMNLEVAGETVVVYPEEKEFTDDGDGIAPLSLLPLEERHLTVDFGSYSPLDLTMVTISSVFAGETELGSDDKIMWKQLYDYDDDYRISSPGDIVDLSYDTYDNSSRWEMILGDDSQLAADNIRYIVTLDVCESEEWLEPILYRQYIDGYIEGDAVFDVEFLEILEDTYWDNTYDDDRELEIVVPSGSIEADETVYIGLGFSDSFQLDPETESIKVFEGSFTDAEEAEAATEITDQLFIRDYITQTGYRLDRYDEQTITIVKYKNGVVTGCLPIRLEYYTLGNSISIDLYDIDAEDGGWEYIVDRSSSKTNNGVRERTYELEYGYPANGNYHLIFQYSQLGNEESDKVTAAYQGLYSTIAAAQAAGAEEIKESLFNDRRGGGYVADYSNGVYFTVFVGEDGTEEQERYQFLIKTEEGEPEYSSNTWVNFTGLRDKDGNWVDCYVVDEKEDSYANYNYLTILVDETADLTSLAPVFYLGNEKLNLYAEGSSSPEISGESLHDFSNGPVQYSASAENKTNSSNYWLQIIPAEGGEGKIYINSLADEEAKTRTEEGVIYSTREVFIDGLHDDVHDILLVNVGTEELPELAVELTSDVIELDDYWTLNGKYGLSGMTTLDTSTSYGELPNLAKIRLKAREGAEGQDASGTVTIKSGETTLAVLTLTGAVGDPTITTKEIPQAVKYVPYGTMIQNSNKYSWNTISYDFVSGTLPAGMELRPNGEIYGVPTEAGEFTFTVRLNNSISRLSSSRRTFTLIVNENTDANVEGATDIGYEVTQRIPNISLSSTSDHTFVSEGVYDEFVDIFLDGQKLTEGVEYSSESGSTRITIRSQTLKASNQTGTHTIGVEFRTKEDNTLKRAAQNYRVTSGSSSSSGSGNGGQNHSDLTVAQPTVITTNTAANNKKGVVNDAMGIITGNEAGYSRWQQDENGWKLIYADGTAAAGYLFNQEDGTAAEQVTWEKVNGSWYAFGTNGYLKSGWVWDYQLGAWYNVTTESGMQIGWYTDAQDNCTYYLDPETGKMALGWKLIDGNWYYFNEVTPVQTWFYDAATGSWNYNVQSRVKPFGSLYRRERTPDHYYVGSDGVWDGKEKQD